MPTILLKKSDTPGSVPGTANLTNLAGGVEVAVNTADKRVYSMTSASAVIELGTNPSSLTCSDVSATVLRAGSATITNLLATTLTVSGGTANGVLYLNGSKVATSGSALVFDGTNLGIGTASPASKLDTAGTIRATSQTVPSSGTGAELFYDATNAGLRGYNRTGSAYVNLALNDNVYIGGGSSGNVGIGTASPAANSLTLANKSLQVWRDTDYIQLLNAANSTYWGRISQSGNDIEFSNRQSGALKFLTADTTRATIDSSGNLGLGVTPIASTGRLQVQGENASTSLAGVPTVSLIDGNANDEYSILRFATSTNGSIAVIGAKATTTGAYPSSVGQLEFGVQNGASTTTVATMTAAGNMGLGVTPSAWNSSFRAMQLGNSGYLFGRASQTQMEMGNNAVFDATDTRWEYITTNTAQRYLQDATSNSHQWFTAPSGTAGDPISFTQAMTLDYLGNLGIGTTSPAFRLDLKGSGAVSFAQMQDSTAVYKAIYGVDSGGGVEGAVAGALTNHPFIFRTNNTERARITSGGDFLVGKTVAGDASIAGCQLNSSGGVFTRSAGDPLLVNRQTDDGVLVTFRQDNTTEGTISVSGNTVSYNAFAGSHWSQLQDGSKPDILRGTVMESINELCVWPDENNERLPKSKISDTAGSKKVYGVFMAWDNDWTETNDMYVTAVGAFICRVNGSVTVQEGDLLESNGDGTARVQADDIIRSSTIGKVTSTVKTHQYADGSYCVPTVLYCG